MLENFMIFSIFLTVLCTLVVLGLLILAGFYILTEHIRDKRKARMQKKLNKTIQILPADKCATCMYAISHGERGNENGDD